MPVCSGRSVFSGEILNLEFSALIDHVEPPLGVLDATDWLSPGFIDLQVNGFAGADYNDPDTTHEAISASLDRAFATGITRLLPTVITGSPDRMERSLRNLAAARESLPHGRAMEAFHVEGPYISPDDGPRGAHPKEWVRPPDLNEFARLQDAARGNIRLLTIAPEWPGAPQFIDRLTGQGVVVSIGHTAASGEQIRDAVSAGATLSTHLGNGAHRVLPRHPNYLWEQLAQDRLAASFIVDGHHLSESFLRVALRAKGSERSVLVTDAVAAAGCEPGDYDLGGVPVTLLADGRVVMRGGERLAGSSLTMDRAIENTLRLGVARPDAFAMAAANPARVGRIEGRLRGLQPGSRGDVVVLSLDGGRVRVLETYLSGELVYKA